MFDYDTKKKEHQNTRQSGYAPSYKSDSPVFRCSFYYLDTTGFNDQTVHRNTPPTKNSTLNFQTQTPHVRSFPSYTDQGYTSISKRYSGNFETSPSYDENYNYFSPLRKDKLNGDSQLNTPLKIMQNRYSTDMSICTLEETPLSSNEGLLRPSDN
jgi:hypothetical protein